MVVTGIVESVPFRQGSFRSAYRGAALFMCEKTGFGSESQHRRSGRTSRFFHLHRSDSWPGGSDHGIRFALPQRPRSRGALPEKQHRHTADGSCLCIEVMFSVCSEDQIRQRRGRSHPATDSQGSGHNFREMTYERSFCISHHGKRHRGFIHTEMQLSLRASPLHAL